MENAWRRCGAPAVVAMPSSRDAACSHAAGGPARLETRQSTAELEEGKTRAGGVRGKGPADLAATIYAVVRSHLKSVVTIFVTPPADRRLVLVRSR